MLKTAAAAVAFSLAASVLGQTTDTVRPAKAGAV